MIGSLYFYRARVVSVYDGDSCSVILQLGFSFTVGRETGRAADLFHIRLLGINAPEIRGDTREAGIVSRDYLRGLILGRNVIVHTYRDEADKYGGRWLAEIYADEVNVNALMIESGHAVPYMERA